MVANVTSMTRNGLRDWIIQRVSAVVIAAYTIFMICYLWCNPNLLYGQWQILFSETWMRVFSLFMLLSLLAHAWIGLWTISTDYLKSTAVRLAFQLIIISVLFICVIWGITILWGM
jgi:succinate dehydrogenase / fumarate reductase membrane anchor subunit